MGHVRSASALILGSIISSFTSSANAIDLPLRRILLTTGGVGYFEHEAAVTGDATLELDVRLDQVSDVLKSIVVFDAHGRMGGATLAGREPLSEIFRDMPFTLADLGSPASLMTALRGSMIRVTANASVVEGRIISVTEETTSLGDGQGTIVRHRMSLMAPTGLRQALIEDATAIEIVDPNLRGQVEQALTAIAEHSEQDRRSIAIRVEGEGERTVTVGYVVAAPLWKATYRLVLPSSGNRAQMEGLALLENMSGQDWIGVDLTVASGNPVTFRQSLYEAYFVSRPEVPVEVFGRILPSIDTGTVAASTEAKARGLMSFLRSPSSVETSSADVEAPTTAPAPLTDTVQGATAVTFHFPEPVDLARGEATLVPIFLRELGASRVSVFRRDVDRTNPVASVNLENDSESSLPPGAVATYERQGPEGELEFVGDARLGPLPMGEERLLGFAADLDVRVDHEDQLAQVVTGATIDRGVLVIRRVEQRQTQYRISGAANEARSIIIEHPRIAGFDLVAPQEGRLGDTPTHHRLAVEVPAGQTVTLDVMLERPIEQRVSIVGMGQSELGVLVLTAEIPDAVREALKQVAQLQRTLADRQQALTALEADRSTVVADQVRIRANLDAVPGPSDLRTRYLTALGETEDRIAALDQSLAAAREAVTVARDELERFIASLAL